MPVSPAAAELIITQYAPEMAAKMRAVADASHSEEDVRHGCNVLIEKFLSQAGLVIPGRHEYGLKGGRIDSKYGGVIIEYKDPKGGGRIGDSLDSPGTKKVVAQVRQRFQDFGAEADEKTDPQRLFGVGCDGRKMIFVRFRGKAFQVEGPEDVTAHAVERLLRALCSVGAHGAPYTPERLTESFGANSALGRDGIGKIYAVISQTQNPKALTFFSQWRILFGEVCGYDVYGKNENIRKLAVHYGIPDAAPAALLFAIHTYYAVFIKLLAAEIASSFSPLGVSLLKKCVAAPTPVKLKEELGRLEQGGVWAELGITNFLEGDLFSWYLPAWNDDLASVVRAMVTELDGYDPTTLSVEPAESRDLLKKLYHHLFPKSVRHDLGEYYTPDWLAEQTLDELGYDGNPDKRLLDPSCGSGTFLVMAINRARVWFEEHQHECGYDQPALLGKILRNIIGFDLNPLAVMAARTNFLIAIRGLLKTAGAVELPVYLCDSIMTPGDYGNLLIGTEKRLKTSVGEFVIPDEVVSDREIIGKYAEVLEWCVRNRYDVDDFLVRCTNEGLPVTEERLHRSLYEQLRTLDAENKNGIWARIIKNAFAPLFIGKVDYIAGNPPWINWESLPGDYRQSTAFLWQKYDLFRHKGYKAKLGGGKDDLSILMTYVAHDHYLAEGGRLGFVITQTVFKTKGGGEGFRTFEYHTEKGKFFLNVVSVSDMSDFQAFEGATNRTAIFVTGKSKTAFDYPVPYTIWRKRDGYNITQDDLVYEVFEKTTRNQFSAAPIDDQVVTSAWMTAPEAALFGLQKVKGKSSYIANAGCSTWLNGVFWISILQHLNNGDLLIENLNSIGKIKVEQIHTVIESSLVYPLLRGRDVGQWKATPSLQVLLPNQFDKLAGISQGEMKRAYPKTYSYLRNFETQLRGRSGYRKFFKTDAPFYSIYNVGPYTLAPWKVVWRDMGSRIQVAVVGNHNAKVVCPEHHVMAIPLQSQTEAHYICSVLMSAPVQLLVAAYTTTTGISTHVLENVALPTFKPGDTAHAELAALSERCHQAAAQNDAATLADLQAQVDRAAAKLWGITEPELAAIGQALDDMRKVKPAAKEADEDAAEEE